MTNQDHELSEVIRTKVHTVKGQPRGMRYSVKSMLGSPDGVVVAVLRKGNELVLQYEDGRQVNIKGFYGADALSDDAEPAVENVAELDRGEGSISCEFLSTADAGIELSDGSQLLYVDGDGERALAYLPHDAQSAEAVAREVQTRQQGSCSVDLDYTPEAPIAADDVLAVAATFLGLVTVNMLGGASAGIRNIVTGSITAGPVVAGNDILVVVFDLNGHVLGSKQVDSSGKYEIDVGAYKGGVVVKAYSKSSGALDFWDEATNQAKDLNVTLLATGVIVNPKTVVNINPLTSVAAEMLGLNSDKAWDDTSQVHGSTDAEKIANIQKYNAAIAKLVGVTGTLTEALVIATKTADGLDNQDNANALGKFLAVMSRMDSKTPEGGMATAIHKIAGATQINSATGEVSVDEVVQADILVAARDEGLKPDAFAETSFNRSTRSQAAAFNPASARSVSELSPSVAVSLSEDKILEIFSSGNGGDLSSNTLRVIDPAVIGHVPADQIKQLDVHQVASMSDAQLGSLTSAQADALGDVNDNKFVELVSHQVTVFKAEAIDSVPTTVLQTMDAKDVAVLTPAQLCALSEVSALGKFKAGTLATIDLTSSSQEDLVLRVNPGLVDNATDGQGGTLTIKGTASDKVIVDGGVWMSMRSIVADGVRFNVYQDNAGDVLQIQQGVQCEIDTAPAPVLVENRISGHETYDSGFTLPAGNTIAGLMIGGNPVSDWNNYFTEESNNAGGKTYVAKAGQFQGTESIVVTVQGAANPDNQHSISLNIALANHINTTAPAPQLTEVLSSAGTSIKSFTLTDGETVTGLSINGNFVHWDEYFTKSTDDAGVSTYAAIVSRFSGAEGNIVVSVMGPANIAGYQAAKDFTLTHPVVDLDPIKTAAYANTADGLGFSAFDAAGIVGVTADNLSAIKSALNSVEVDSSDVSTRADLQRLVDAYQAILNGADGTPDDTRIPSLKAEQYQFVGITGITGNTLSDGTSVDSYVLNLLNSVVGNKNQTDVSDHQKLQGIANAAVAVNACAAGDQTTLSVQNLADLGITVAVGDLNLVREAIASTLDDGSDVDTYSKLQATVNGAVFAPFVNGANNNNAGAGLTQGSFDRAGVTRSIKDIEAIKSALNSEAVTGNDVSNLSSLNQLVDSYNTILGAAHDSSSHSSEPIPASAFQHIGVVDHAEERGIFYLQDGTPLLSLFNDVVHSKDAADINTVDKLQALVEAVKAVIDAVDDDKVAPTQAQFEAIGITGVTPNNLSTVLACIAGLTTANAVSTVVQLQGVVSEAALNALQMAAVHNDASDLTREDFDAAGVTPDSSSVALKAYETALNGTFGNAAGPSQVALQHMVDAYNAILSNANGTSGDTALIHEIYANVGVTNAPTNDDAPALLLVNSIVDRSTRDKVDTFGELQAIVDAANAVIGYVGSSDTNPPSDMLGYLQALGLKGVTSSYEDVIWDAIRNASMTDINTFDGLQNRLSLATKSPALLRIATKAGSNTAVITPLTVGDFEAAGMTGVTDTPNGGNLGAICTALDSSAVNTSQIISIVPGLHGDEAGGGLQRLINSYSAILVAADSAGNFSNSANTTALLPSSKFTDVGVTGVFIGSSSGNIEKLLSDAVDHCKAVGQVDTVGKLQNIANAAKKVIDYAAGDSSVELGADDFALLGVNGINANDATGLSAVLSDVLSRIRGVGPGSCDTISEIQGLVTGVAKARALDKIATAAANNSAANTQTQLTVGDFEAAGMTGVTDTPNGGNLGAICTALDSSAVNTSQIISIVPGLHGDEAGGGLQRLINSYSAILVAADSAGNFSNSANTTALLPSSKFTDVGVTGVFIGSSSGNIEKLLSDAVDHCKAVGQVDTVGKLQNIANAAKKVIDYAAGDSSVELGADDFALLGVNGINANDATGLSAVLSRIRDVDPANCDTVGELKAILADALGANALARIATAAANNSAANAQLTIGDFEVADITGVTDSNLTAIISALDTDLVGNVRTGQGSPIGGGLCLWNQSQLQSVVTAYADILAAADSAGNFSNSANTTLVLNASQFTAIGVVGVTADSNIERLLSDIVDNSTDATTVNSVSNLQRIVSAANAMMKYVKDGVTPPLIDELRFLGLTVPNEAVRSAVNNALNAIGKPARTSNTSPDFNKVDTVGELRQLLSNAVNPRPVLANKINAKVDQDLIFAFNTNISFGGSGTVTLHDMTHPDNPEKVFSVGSSELTIDGNTLKVNPADDLLPGTKYSVQISSGAIKSISTDTFYTGTTDTFTTKTATQNLWELYQGADAGHGRADNGLGVPAYTAAMNAAMATKGDISYTGETKLAQYINAVTGTDIVSAAEFGQGFVITGHAAPGKNDQMFYLDKDRTDGKNQIGKRLVNGEDGVSINYSIDTGDFTITFDPNSRALKQATHNTYGSGVHQLWVDANGDGSMTVGESNRLFLVADGTAAQGDASNGTIAANFSVQDKVTHQVFIYFYGDVDGSTGLGMYTLAEKSETSKNDNVSIDRDTGGYSGRSNPCDFFNFDTLTSANARPTPDAQNTAMGYVTHFLPNTYEFSINGNAKYSSVKNWEAANTAAVDHVAFNSNTSRLASLEELLAVYAANFNGKAADDIVGPLEPANFSTSYLSYNSNMPTGWASTQSWSASPTPSGHATFSLGSGHIVDRWAASGYSAVAVL